MLDAMLQTLDSVVAEVKKIEPSHQIMSDVQRRTKYQDINARFPFYAFKCNSTWVKYFRTITKISLVIFRLIELGNKSTNDDTDRDTSTGTIPKPKFTKEQKKCYTDIQQCNLEEGPERSLLYIEFLLSLVNVTIDKEMKDIALLNVFAMISVKDDDSMADAISTTPVIAAIIAVYKLLFLAKSINCYETVDTNKLYISDDEAEEEDKEEDTNNDGAIDKSDNGNDDGNCESKSWVKTLHKYVKKHFFVNDFGTVHSPITALIKMFHYGKKIAREHTGIGTIRWEADTVFYRDMSLSVTDYRWCIQNGITKLTRTLLKLLRLDSCNRLPIIPWEKIVDDQNINRPNYSFLTEEGNQHWLSTSHHMNTLTKRLAKEVMADDGKIKEEFVKSYEKEIKEYLKLLLALMHVTGGQPARGTEITNLTFTNTSYMSRNISMYRGMVCFCTTYHKGMMHSGKLKRIFRFLPQPVGEALVYYLWLVLPFWQRIQGAVTTATITSPHVWSKNAAMPVSDPMKTEVWSTDALSQGLASLFVDNKMNVRIYRHVIIAIARKFLKENWGNDSEDEELYEEFGDDANDVAICNDVLDMQAGHTTATAVRVYARGTNENRTTFQGNMDEYYDCTIKHHNFIFNRPNLLARSTTSMDQLTDQLLRQKYHQLLQKERLQSLLLCDLDSSLRSFMNNNSNAVFRGNQRKTIESIIERHSVILQIAGTGVGKSLSFMLPAFMSNGGTTIVVVPLVALQQNLLARCLASNISAAIWKHGVLPTPTKIMFVSPESVSSKSFLDYINMLHDSSLLDRIVLDECHLYLTSTETFRAEMMNVSNFVRMFGVQVVMLTATLPERCQSELLEKFSLDKVPITVMRDPTTRKNVRYEVRCVGNQALLGQVQAVLNEPRFQNERIIIYVKAIADGKKIAEELKFPFYYAKNPDKKVIMDHWISATKNRAIVSTSAMGCGIDIPDIRLVLHAGAPNNMIDFAQQSGRAGRDGNVSYSILLYRKFESKYLDVDMTNFVNGHGNCRRIALDYAMDGIDREHCTRSECPCDCCCVTLLDLDARTTAPLTCRVNGGGIGEDDNDGDGDGCGAGIGDDDVGGMGNDDGNNDDNSNDHDTMLFDTGTNIDGVMENECEMNEVTTRGLIVTPGNQTPAPPPTSDTIITTDSASNTNSSAVGLELQRKRLFLEQGLIEEQRKRSNYRDVNREESFDLQNFEYWLSTIPSKYIPNKSPPDGCFVCRILNLTGPCVNRKEHNTQRYQIEKARKLVGDKVNPCGASFAGVPIPMYCCCAMPGCYVPQMLCSSWESNGNGGYLLKSDKSNRTCEHGDKILDVILALKDQNEESAAYVLEKCDGDLTKLLTTKIEWGREKLLLLHRVFIDLCKKYLISE
jgi:superfamily II DNA or RNA helicase